MRRQPSGTWLVIAILTFALVIGIGRAVMKRVGDAYPVPASTRAR